VPIAISDSTIRRLGLAVAAAASLAATSGHAADPIKVGVTITQSPPGSVVQGTQVKDGLELAQKMINDAGGVNGRPIELLIEDTQGIPEKARAAVEKLITRDKVVAVTGEHQSSAALAGIEVAHRYKVPYINTNGWSDVIREKGYPEVFNPGNYNSRVAQAMANTLKDLKVKRVVGFAENTDYGIGLATLLGKFIKEEAPGIEYRFETLDRASKDYLPAILPLRANPPDAIVEVMLPPATYILMNQLYEQGVSPTSKTWFYDGSGVVDYPDFWQNVKEAGKDILFFGLYHPKMNMPPLGQKVSKLYEEKFKREPNRLLFQAVDCLFLIAEAVKQGGSTDPEAMIKALENIKWEGTRGTITFSKEKGYKYHQWLDVPYVTLEVTAVNQPISETKIVQEPGQPLDMSKVEKPGK
jgi:branched-chain amino acid transport system substrate-binding protein